MQIRSFYSKYFPSHRSLVLGIFVGGTLLRLWHFLYSRSLWLDEAHVAEKLLAPSFWTDLIHGDWYQTLPVGLAIATRILTEIFGDSEYILRLIPLVSGILVLTLSHRVFKGLLPEKAQTLCLLLLAFSPTLIFFASEFKQYSSDVAISLLLIHLVLPQLREEDPPSLKPLAMVGSLALWFSHASLFILTSAGAVLLFHEWQQRHHKRLLRLVGVGVAWSVSLLLNYFLFLEMIATDNLRMSWVRFGGFGPVLATFNGWLDWVGRFCTNFFSSTLGIRFTVAALVVACLGLFAQLRARKKITCFLIAPIPLLLVAAYFRFYPATGRLLLFLAPITAFLLATGTLELIERRSLGLRLIGYGLALLFILPIAPQIIGGLIEPRHKEHTKPLLRQIQKEAKSADWIYVSRFGTDAFNYHTRHIKLSNPVFFATNHSKTRGASHARLAATLEREELRDFIAQHKRVWIFLSHASFQQQQRLFNEVRKQAKQLSIVQGVECALALFEAEVPVPE